MQEKKIKILLKNPFRNRKGLVEYDCTIKAGVAQLVEQLICNQSVMSSSLFTSYNNGE